MKNYTLIAAAISRKEKEYLDLYCFAKKTTKSKILRMLLNRWRKETSMSVLGGDMELDLIRWLTLRYQAEWTTFKLENHEEDYSAQYNAFMSKASAKMQSKGIPYNTVCKILKSVQI